MTQEGTMRTPAQRLVASRNALPTPSTTPVRLRRGPARDVPILRLQQTVGNQALQRLLDVDATVIRRKKSSELFITNEATYTPEWMKAHGYKYVRWNTAAWVWANAEGKEIWVIPKKSSAAPLVAAPPEHASVTEAREQAEYYSRDAIRLEKLARNVRAHVGKEDYKALWDQMMDVKETWFTGLFHTLEKQLPLARLQIDPADTRALAAFDVQAKRLDELHKQWFREVWHPLVRDLNAQGNVGP